MIAVPTLYGKFAATCHLPPAANWSRSAETASSRKTSRFPGLPIRLGSIAARSESSSTVRTRTNRRISSLVSAPRPGPISKTRNGSLSSAPTIAVAVRSSCRKCWPSFWRRVRTVATSVPSCVQ